ncbi:hypothetical protein TBR22_A06290 [Luteitalea sp. TBR-22]|uniref:hypothetical protein n=1 Tax=Luteitalea sp. TBR-22 TaxID=2802971 RepID=UPI001AF46BC3|nr:hypothetical protein [Luteitalea sp. TBR-22]BCS31428.1 hypothetical protein TBR22_A06290 [Luteitalea sp. TBR-22]
MPDVSVDLGPVVRSINNLSAEVQRDLHVINSRLEIVNDKVEAVATLQSETQDRLEALYEEFSEFVAADRKHKERQFAQTRLIEVNQDIETRFGHYDEVRRTTTGILQASDVALVRQETMRSATEALMLSAPGYWLAPALVALTAWFADNRPLAEKAATEALRRDDCKASLFFALVCRRARRLDAGNQWLKRYFQIQNPQAMDREVVLMLDAMANGVFGGAALTECSQVIETWLTELELQAGFLDEQRARWMERLDVMTPSVAPGEYPSLRRFSPSWNHFERSLALSRRHAVVLAFFTAIFEGAIVVPPSLEAAVDSLLESLVTNYDDEELPLRRELRLLQLIVQERGDVNAAKAIMAAEADSFAPQTNFAAMLTNSAMNPEQFGATKATQRYALSRSRNWILTAHKDLLARDRAQVPAAAEIVCASWSGISADGSNERGLLDSLSTYYAEKIEEAVSAVGMSPVTWIVLAIGVAVGLLFVSSGSIPLGLILMLGSIAYTWTQYSGLSRRREDARKHLEREHEQATQVLKASLAELVDLRREMQREEAKAEEVTAFLESLSSPQFVLQRPEHPRATVA